MSRPATSVRALLSKDVPIEPSHAAPDPSPGPSPGPRPSSAPAAPSPGPRGANGARALNGAGEAWSDVLLRTFNELRDDLISTLWFVLGNQEDAQDVAQEVFLRCWRAQE